MQARAGTKDGKRLESFLKEDGQKGGPHFETGEEAKNGQAHEASEITFREWEENVLRKEVRSFLGIQ